MLVNELARESGVSAHAVRYYARIGLLHPGRNPDNGYQVFSRRDVGRLAFVRRAQALGLTLTEIIELLERRERGREACLGFQGLLGNRLGEIRREIEALWDRERRITGLLDRCDPVRETAGACGPACDETCPLRGVIVGLDL